MKYFLTIVALLVIIGGGWYVLSIKEQGGNTTETTDQVGTETATSTTDTASSTQSTGTSGVGVGVGVDVGVSVGTVKEVVVDGSSFTFSQKEIRVKEGTRVKLTFKNTGGTHDFVLDAFNVRTNRLQSGEMQTIEFVANKKGTFEYYCSVGTHRQMGMMGNLIVE